MTDDLVTWLREQLDDDEQLARAVLGADASSWDPYGYLPGEKRDYLARFDSARVLAEGDAKRRILDLHSPVELEATHYRPAMLQCRHCAGHCHSRSGLGCDEPIDAPWPCDTVRLLALPYADRPGYRDEWRP